MFYMINNIIFVSLLYVGFTFSEYFVHRYVMHSTNINHNMLSSSHWNHHKHTLKNMELVKSSEYNLPVQQYTGLYLTWDYTGAIFVVGLIEGEFLYLFLKFHNIVITQLFLILWVFLFSVYQTSFWNTVHPDVHKVYDNISWREGIPGWNGWMLLFSSIYVDKNVTLYQWFINNHTIHHLRKGLHKGNYNVTLPGADYILGTMYEK